MITMTKSLSAFIWKYYKDLYVPLTFGHIELLTDNIQEEYIEWCQTEEAKQYFDKEEREKECVD